ncbi:hypothetical protein HHK36_001875 [Tetracentron sinense]|uniref:DUF1421 domain-containing protein n=1 Tax=Tetracentron sinense TaxID=13715 RepID=A0A835DS01_TETSI|nr:hypothetical protein HHK36_001875 [Tetracentron sinense]
MVPPLYIEQDFREGRMGRSALSNVFREESLNQEVISTVEKTMKKYADNLLRFLEGISGRLAQLELYCYNLEKSIGEMRSDLVHDHSEADSKLRSLEKHLQEVHRSVQILRDKQELVETQKELAKLQHVQKESSIKSHSEHNGKVAAPSPSDSKKTDSTPDIQNPQLALALPHQVPVPPSLPARPVEQHQPLAAPSRSTPQNVPVQTQPHAYYSSQNQLPNLPAQTQHHPQDPYLHADPQYQRPQVQDLSMQTPQQPLPPPTQVNQTQQTLPFSQYQQQWPQQFPQPVQPPQQPSTQAQIRPQTTKVYPPYPPTQPANPSPDTFPGSMPMQVPYSGIPQLGASHAEPMAYGYGGAGRTTLQQQPPPQHNMQRQPQPQTNQGTFGAHLGDGVGGYPGAGPHPTQSPGQGYMLYDGEGGRASHPPPPPPHFSQGGYPPTHISSVQNTQPTTGSSLLVRHPSPSQMMRSHPYSELIEKAVSMGYGREHVASVIHRMEESGQPVDFNAVLDRLNVHSSGGSQRGWSG